MNFRRQNSNKEKNLNFRAKNVYFLFFSLVAIVHCETSSGVVNSVEKIAELVKSIQPKSSVFVDAMSSFGAISLDLQNCDWMVSSANKCLQGVPGFAYAICRKSKLQSCKGN